MPYASKNKIKKGFSIHTNPASGTCYTGIYRFYGYSKIPKYEIRRYDGGKLEKMGYRDRTFWYRSTSYYFLSTANYARVKLRSLEE